MRPINALATLLLLGGACASGPKPAAQSPEREPAPAAPTTSTKDAMQQHFADATAALDAVIAGRLQDVRPPLLRLSQAGDEGNLNADWLPWVNDMRAVAKRGAEATTLAGAAEAVAALGTACGDCHRTTHGGPAPVVAAPAYNPAGKQGLEEKMARHRYSADTLWLGITGPTHQEWSNGASALMNITVPGLVTEHGDPATADRRASGEGELQGKADSRLPPQEEEGEPAAKSSQTVDLDPALRELRELGTVADRATIARDKEAVFAQIIERCGACHARLKVQL